MTKNEAINIIRKCAKKYKRNLEGNSLLLVFEEHNKIEYVEIKAN